MLAVALAVAVVGVFADSLAIALTRGIAVFVAAFALVAIVFAVGVAAAYFGVDAPPLRLLARGLSSNRYNGGAADALAQCRRRLCGRGCYPVVKGLTFWKK